MACDNCSKSKVLSVCRVCELVDGDYTEKEVAFCKICVAYICERCWNSKSRRMKAATKSGIKSFVDSIIGKFKK